MKLSKYEKKNLEELLHNACVLRDGGKCLRCGKEKTLSASHIYPKGHYKKMRYLLENVITLCFPCHINWWHKNPMEANDWIKTVIEPERLARLKLASQIIDKKPVDFKMMMVYLKNEIKGMA